MMPKKPAFKVEANELDGVTTEIKIGDKICDCQSLTLKQSMYGHSTFEIVVNYKTQDKSIWEINPDELIKQQLGEKVRISIKHLVGGEEVRFYGYITDMMMGGNSGDQGHVILKGGSPTLFLDRDKSMDYYTDCSLAMIAADVLKKSGIAMSFKNEVEFNQAIPYICRYKETSYAFLARVLRGYGEWFYYDGEQVILGNPYRTNEGTEIKVAYDVELLELTLTGSIQNMKTALTAYNPDTDTRYDEVLLSGIDGQTLNTTAAKKKSNPIYPTESILPISRRVVSGADTTQENKSWSSRKMTELSCLEAKSRTCKIQLGTLLVTKVPDTLPGMEKTIRDLGRYRVVEITHTVTGTGEYSNSFKGIPGSAVGMAMGDAKEVFAYPELAKVVYNNDPQHLGRVQVRFCWQEYRAENRNIPYTTSWMPVQTPDAGSSDTVSKNRGMVFIPEEGDMVMIGYEQGNPSSPFVMGSMWNMKNAGGAAADNSIKSIRTKSGHTIEFNDADSAMGITIKDKEGNKIHIDTKGKNIEITAPETMTLNAKNITINAQESLNTSSGKDTVMQVGENLSQSVSKNHDLDIQEAHNLSVGKAMTMNVGDNFTQDIAKDMTFSANNIQGTGQGEIKISSQQDFTLKGPNGVTMSQ